jgi:predicted permease
MEEEMRLHVEERAEELMAGGMSRRDALAAARREFGSAARIAEESREAWRLAWIEDLWRDFRYGVRALRRDRGFAITAVLSLALGIGVNTAIFSLTAEFLFSQPSVRDPDTLVRVEIGGSVIGMREYRFLRDAKVLEELAGANEMQEVNWRSGDVSSRLFSTRVTDNFFDVTGTPVALGRGLQNGERNAAVISHRFWQTRLNGDDRVLSRMLVLDGAPYAIVGVLPAGHRSLIGFGYVPDLYLPVAGEAGIAGLYGRVAASMSPSAAVSRLRSACAELDKVYPDGNHKRTNHVTVSGLLGLERLGQGFLRSVTMLFAILMATVALLLLIACANVAGLLLARASTRVQEFAIRMSIGAGRGRVIRQMLAESLMLSLLGTAAGLALNYLLTRLLNRAVIAAPVPLRLAIEPDWRLLMYAAAIAVGTALAAGVLPAVKSAKGGTSAMLKRNEHQVSGRRAPLRNLLVAGQLAISVVMLIMAVLAVRNLMQSSTLDPGFDIRRTVWAQMRLVPESYPDAKKVRAAISSALERLRGMPGVTSAAVAAVVPLNDHFLSRSTAVYTDVLTDGKRIEHAWNAVGPDYFKTMGIALVAGREFTSLDREGTARVAILNETFARKAFGGANAVGRRIRFGRDDRFERTVVGVARNSKYSTIGERDRAAMYECYFQVGGRPTVQLLLKAAGPPDALLRPVNAELLSADPAAAVELKPMSRALAFAMMPSQAGAILLGSIGLLGLVLAAVGLYGLLAYAISRRTREIGLRVALGARRGDVVRLVMREGAWIVGTGLGVGTALALFVTRPLARFLVPGITPGDPLTYALVGAVLLAAGCAACFVPMLRALRIDPMLALRYE